MAKPICASALDAIADMRDGASILVHSFGPPQSWPIDLLEAVREKGVSGLTVICNSTGVGPTSAQILAEKHQIRKIVCTYAIYPIQKTPLAEQIRSGEVELELVPQGTLIERVRAGGAGLAAFYTPTGVGTAIADGKEVREIDGKRYLLETAIRADYAFLRADRADAAGNLTYRRGARNFAPAFATAARTTIAEVNEFVPCGAIDPEAVVTPGIFVDRLLAATRHFDAATIRKVSFAIGRLTSLEGRPVREGGPLGLPADLMAMRAAALLDEGEYVNLGLGLPTLVSNYIAGRGVTMHAENGVLGYGPFPEPGHEDVDLYNASGQLVTPTPSTAYFDSCLSFAMARTGRVSTIVLGAFQVASNGDLANWNVPTTGVGGIGGAMDLAAGGARVIVVMYQTMRSGESKLVERLTYPPTALGCVRSVVTDLALLDVTPEGFLLREVAPGVGVDDVRAACGAPLRLASDVREMVFA
ncbi:MAG TPA: 3-oxoacid CoA-transferase subunit A [Candidatus Bathyarchaeia archaeon]|nr:3-oxoacid CoA-transferase subunit A [Candidatus Bathyarchaeia archaeon]